MGISTRIISFSIVIAIVLSCVPFASAAASSDIIVDSASVSEWNTFIADNKSFLVTASTAQSHYWSYINDSISRRGIGAVSSIAALTSIAKGLPYGNSSALELVISALSAAYGAVFGDTEQYIVSYDSTLGLWRIFDNHAHLWLVNEQGHFPYYKPESTTDPDTGDTTTDNTNMGGNWITYSEAKGTSLMSVVAYASLTSLCITLDEAGASCRVAKLRGYNDEYYYFIYRSGYVYANSKGYPYVAHVDEDSYAVNNGNNYYTQEGDTVEGDTHIYNEGDTDNSQTINIGEGAVYAPDGTVTYIEEAIYDSSTKTYTVNSMDGWYFDMSTNYYITNNYTYNIQYYISYTSVTYIGYTEEYDKYYEVYYELPDGRSSADLTAEELEQLNVSIDVINYSRSADDVSLRSLYHFDGDTRDSSYWSYCTDFTWDTGASLTYMDAGVFNGALYLDEHEHEFTVTLPSSISSGDFTIQFRYYQSHTEIPSLDSYISLNGSNLFQFDGSDLYNSSSALSTISTGVWNEICIMRKDGIIYRFLNGVVIDAETTGSTEAYGDKLIFYFGSSQQTFKYLDELRVLNYGAYDPSGYTPTAVPYDTNLSLVLPDGTLPVADEYWSFSGIEDNENLLVVDEVSVTPELFTSGYDIGLDDATFFHSSDNDPSYVDCFSNSSEAYSSASYGKIQGMISSSYINGYVNSSYYDSDDVLSLTYSSNCITLSSTSGHLYLPFYFGYRSNISSNKSFSETASFAAGNYILSIVLADGSVCSVPFVSPSDYSYYSATSAYPDFVDMRTTYEFDTLSLSVCYTYLRYSGYAAGCDLLYLDISMPNPIDIVYMEIIPGTETDIAVEWVTSVTAMDAESLNTPTLAVRSDIEVTDWQIGGVRPSLPSKGLVWALVEDSYITSLQIYTGSAWEAVDGRIWTGERWVPYYSYDVILLKDMYDVIDASGSDYEYIYTETGFWSWLQDAWGNMMDKLDEIITAIKNVGGGGNDYDIDVDVDIDATEDGDGLVETVAETFESMWYVLKFFGGLFSAVFDNMTDNLTEFTNSVNTTDNTGMFGFFFHAIDPAEITETEVE